MWKNESIMNTSYPLVVLKFGGSSVASPEKIKHIASKIATRHKNGETLIVVVSAMGKTTDQLLKMAKEITNKPNRREMDMLLTSGERISMALLALALNDLGCPAISYTGSQAGVFTDGSFTDAKIIDIKPIRMQQSLNEGKVIVLAGFQGVDPITKEVTTLGRGGSDTTSVAMASHFGASHCEILKDVNGVFSADPQLIPEAQLISEMDLDSLYEFCFWGAKVLNYRSVDWALKHHVELHIGRSDNFEIGTVAKKIQTNDSHQKPKPLGINSHTYVIELAAHSSDLKTAKSQIQNRLESKDLAMPQILHATIINNESHFFLACDEYSLPLLTQSLTNETSLRLVNDQLSTVAITFSKIVSDNMFPAELISTLRDQNPSLQKGQIFSSFHLSRTQVAIVPRASRLEVINSIYRYYFKS